LGYFLFHGIIIPGIRIWERNRPPGITGNFGWAGIGYYYLGTKEKGYWAPKSCWTTVLHRGINWVRNYFF